MEDDLGFTDGAQPVYLLYKNKYMGNELIQINYSFAIIEFVVKMLQLIGYQSLSDAQNSLANDAAANLTYSRTRDFLLYNANVSLRVTSENIIEKYFATLQDIAQNGRTVL